MQNHWKGATLSDCHAAAPTDKHIKECYRQRPPPSLFREIYDRLSSMRTIPYLSNNHASPLRNSPLS